jgi:hypothetical protein
MQAMWPAIRRVLGLDRRRAFDAAGGGRRWEGAKSVGSLNTAILAGAIVAARRAGYYARNNPWVAAAVQALIANAVGTGIKPRSAHPDSNVCDALHRLWARWTDGADANGLTDFHGLLQRFEETGSVAAKPSGGSTSPLEKHAEFLLGLMTERPDMTLDEIVAAMRKRRIGGSRSAVWRFFARRNISFKKNSVRGGAETRGRRSRTPTLDARTRHV